MSCKYFLAHTLVKKINPPLIGLTGLALLLRLWRIDFRSIWLDEAYSLRLASTDIAGILSGSAMDIHPPLFHLLLAGWIRLFGTSEFALRSLSALAGALLVPLVFKLTRTWVNRQAAWITAALITLSPYFIELSRSGRMAALLTFFSVLSVYFFRKVIEQGDALSISGYWAATLAAMYTHYFAFLPFIAQHLFIFMGIGKLRLSRSIRKHWMLLQMLLLAGYAPWLYSMWNHLSKGGPAWRGVGVSWLDPMHSIYTFFVGTSCWTWWHKITAVGFLGIVLIGVIIYGVQHFSQCFQLTRPRIWGLLLTLIIVPLGCVWVYSLCKMNVFDNRYLGISAVMVFICLGSLLSLWPKGAKATAVSLLVLAFSIPLFNQYFVYGYYDNWRAAAAQIKKHAKKNDVIAIYPAWNETPLNYYLQDQWLIFGIPGEYDPISGKTEGYFDIGRQSIQQLESKFSGRDQLWLILVNEGDLQTVVRQWFRQAYYVSRQNKLGSIEIIELLRKEVP